jgi:uncharacterized protein YjeT (DUF2065 family)
MVSAMNALKVAAFVAMGAVLILSGLVYFHRAQEFADMIAGQIAAHPWRRLWLPARWYTSRKFFWQLRIAAVGTVLIGVILILSAFAALLYHQ